MIEVGPDARVGVLSDTHGKLYQEVVEALADVDLIVHAGDVGKESVLFELQTIAPVLAVQGNVDPFFSGWPLPTTAWAMAGDKKIFVTHRFDPSSPAPEGAAVVVAGHTHVPRIEHMPGGALFVNPGGAYRSRAPGRSSTLAIVSFAAGSPSALIVDAR